MQIPLRPYQESSVKLICAEDDPFTVDLSGVQKTFSGVRVTRFSRGRALCEIDAGLGKSRIAIECLKRLVSKGEKILIVCKKNSINTWRREIARWWPEMADSYVVIHGQKPTIQKFLWIEIAKPQYPIVITTYDGVKNQFEWIPKTLNRMVIADECQKIRNHKTALSKANIKLLKRFAQVIMLSGIIVRDGPQDLYTYMHILNPKLHSSYWHWIGVFCILNKNHFGTEIVGPKNTQALANLLAHCFVRIKEKDVEDQRPPLNRDLLTYEMDKQQQGLYDQMTSSMLAVGDEGQLILAPNAAVQQLRLRQILVCPKILDESWGYGAGIEAIVDRFEEDQHNVIFTPFTKAIPHLIQYIMHRGYPEPYVLQGGHTPDHIKRVEEQFNEFTGKQRSCIVSTKFAESFELYSAKACYHLGFEWMQDVNYQAEKRLHRLTTPHPVNSYYLAAQDSVDYTLLTKLEERQWNVNMTFHEFQQIATAHLIGE